MTLYYTVCVQVSITILSYIQWIITSFKKSYSKGKGTNSSASPNNIFEVNKYCERLDQKKSVQFHNLVANNFYATKKSGPYTCTYIAYLTKMVQASNKYDWEKLVHLM